MSTTQRLASLALASVAVVAIDCGGSSDSSSSTSQPTTLPPAAAATVATAADPNGGLFYSPKDLTLLAGKDVVTLTNDSSVAHGLVLVDPNGATVGEIPVFTGGKKSLDVSLKAGNYTFYCQVPGHKEAGMVGTLTVS